MKTSTKPVTDRAGRIRPGLLPCFLFLLGLLLLISSGTSLGRSYKFITIHYPGSYNTAATSINDRGHIIGIYNLEPNGPIHSFLFMEGTYYPVDMPGSERTQVHKINNAFKIAGSYDYETEEDVTLSLGFIKQGETYTSVDLADYDIPTAIVEARVVDYLDRIYGIYLEYGWWFRGFILDQGEVTTVTANIAGTDEYTLFQDVNNLGHIAGVAESISYGALESFVITDLQSFIASPRDPDSYRMIEFPGSRSYTTSVGGINDDGAVVGFYHDPAGNRHGYLSDENDYESIDVPEVSLTSCFDINNYYQIVGSYMDDEGAFHGFLADPDGLVPRSSLLAYDNLRDITWLTDANPALSLGEPPYQNGFLTKSEALGFVDRVNSQYLLGRNEWRLPKTSWLEIDPNCSQTNYEGMNCTASEMGHLYYISLGNDPGTSTGVGQPFLRNRGPFVQLETDAPYWSQQDFESPAGPQESPAFLFFNGYQTRADNLNQYHVMLVHNGDLVPLVNTPVGTSVAYSEAAVNITFSEVKVGGNTSIRSSDTGPLPTDGFSICEPPVYYEISSTVIHSGQIEICLPYPGDCGSGDPVIAHYTESGVDYIPGTVSNGMICGNVENLSTFTAGILPDRDLDGDGYYGRDDCDETRSDINICASEICGDGADNDCDGLIDEDECTNNQTRIVSLKARIKEFSVILEWKSLQEMQKSVFLVYRTEGFTRPGFYSRYKLIGRPVPAKGNGGSAYYTFTDKQVEPGRSYHYAIKNVSIDEFKMEPQLLPEGKYYRDRISGTYRPPIHIHDTLLKLSNLMRRDWPCHSVGDIWALPGVIRIPDEDWIRAISRPPPFPAPSFKDDSNRWPFDIEAERVRAGIFREAVKLHGMLNADQQSSDKSRVSWEEIYAYLLSRYYRMPEPDIGIIVYPDQELPESEAAVREAITKVNEQIRQLKSPERKTKK